ncbi:MAG: cyclic nucleotide-binding domain-containing protein [Acidimicrobiia bacterium]|nr:cyclic nucleotide-binding domain-containing protein [Acidimicrobiia bacterium]
MTESLRNVPLLADLPEADLQRLEAAAGESRHTAGDVLFEEGAEADEAYLISEGEIEILKELSGQHVRIAVSGPGDIVGEMGLLTGEPRSATAKALTDCRLITIPKACLDDVLATSAEANRALFNVFIHRWREQESSLRQSQRMAQIGVLTAGLAHEMNNPAAAAASASEALPPVVHRAVELALDLPRGVEIPTPSQPGVILSSLARADVEEELEEALEDLDVPEPWRHAAALEQAGFRAEDLPKPGPHAAEVTLLAATVAEADSLASQIGEGTHRLSELVGALKSYTFLDRAPVQDVDVTKGLEDTLLILKSKLKNVRVTKHYADDIPTITAHGSELNQVWTNLIDNAIDAIEEAGLEDGEITVSVDAIDDGVQVEIANTGNTIPPDVIDHIFDAFFTTKEPGKGTGLGLDIAYSIIVSQHRGSLTVTSTDGLTTFTATLPIEQSSHEP